MTMNLKPHKVCEDLWKESHFNHLQRIVIDMAQFSHCYKQTIARGETDKHEGFFEDAYKLACSEDRLPCMDESRLSIRLRELILQHPSDACILIIIILQTPMDFPITNGICYKWFTH